MSERKRRPLSLAQRDALIRPLWPRESRAGVLPTDPPAQGGALFRREDVDAAIERGATLSPSDRQALLMGTFADRPRNDTPTPNVVREMFRAEYLGEWPRERDQRGLPRDAIAFRGRVYDRTATLDALDRERAARVRAQRDENGGTFSNGPRATLTVDALNAAVESLRGPRVALPQTIAMSPSLYAEMRRFGARRSDDQTDALAWVTGIDWSAAEVRERRRRSAAQYEREAPWRKRILASIPAPRHITAAELRARVVLPTLRERLGLCP